MNFLVIDEVLCENIELLDRASAGIRQCLSAYETRCSELIVEIGKCVSVSDAEQSFDSLLQIQGRLAALLFKYRFDIGSKLEALTREFDRLHDPYIREYWFGKFKDGARWLEPI